MSSAEQEDPMVRVRRAVAAISWENWLQEERDALRSGLLRHGDKWELVTRGVAAAATAGGRGKQQFEVMLAGVRLLLEDPQLLGQCDPAVRPLLARYVRLHTQAQQVQQQLPAEGDAASRKRRQQACTAAGASSAPKRHQLAVGAAAAGPPAAATAAAVPAAGLPRIQQQQAVARLQPPVQPALAATAALAQPVGAQQALPACLWPAAAGQPRLPGLMALPFTATGVPAHPAAAVAAAAAAASWAGQQPPAPLPGGTLQFPGRAALPQQAAALLPHRLDVQQQQLLLQQLLAMPSRPAGQPAPPRPAGGLAAQLLQQVQPSLLPRAQAAVQHLHALHQQQQPPPGAVIGLPLMPGAVVPGGGTLLGQLQPLAQRLAQWQAEQLLFLSQPARIDGTVVAQHAAAAAAGGITAPPTPSARPPPAAATAQAEQVRMQQQQRPAQQRQQRPAQQQDAAGALAAFLGAAAAGGAAGALGGMLAAGMRWTPAAQPGTVADACAAAAAAAAVAVPAADDAVAGSPEGEARSEETVTSEERMPGSSHEEGESWHQETQQQGLRR